MNKKIIWAVVIAVIAIGIWMLIPPNYTPKTPFAEHVRGNPDAKVTITEFSDFECPACQSQYGELHLFVDAYNDSVKFVYKHFPLTSIHPRAMRAAQASECASDQGKFWEYHDEIFGTRDLSDTALKRYAREIGIDEDLFWACLRSNVMAKRVEANLREGVQAGVDSTPTFVINGRRVPGVQSREALLKATGLQAR